MLRLVESSGYQTGSRQEAEVPREVRNYEGTIRSAFPETEADMVVRMFDHYRNQRIGQGHDAKCIYRDIGTVLDYMLFAEEPRFKIAAPWEWEEERWSAWCKKIATEPLRKGKKKGLAAGSQRNCQTAVRLFFRCVAGCEGIQKDALAQFGVRMREFVNRWNSRVHVTDDATTREKPHFTPEEIRRFFAALKEMIAEAEEFGLVREALHLMRDLALFRIIYWFGLRVDEALRLNTTSFFENDYLEWIARLTSHIPDRGTQLVHYYGAYSNAHRGIARRREVFVGVPPEDDPPDPPRPDSAWLAARRKSWAHLIRRVYEADPLLCRCGQRMRVVGFITQAPVIRKILDHIGRRFDPLKLPGRSPPLGDDFFPDPFPDYGPQ